jgi:hypothetical protein
MTVVASQLSPRTILPGFATALSGAQDSQDQSYRNRAALRDGGGDGRVPVPTAPRQWPRVFPGL